MFSKNKHPLTTYAPNNAAKKPSIPTVITHDMSVLGNVVSEGIVDFDGVIDGNIRCKHLTVRANAHVKGEVVADTVLVYGKINGLIRARMVHLHSGCRIDGVVMHESLSIEDGAFIDGKLKRTDKIQEEKREDEPEVLYEEDDEPGHMKVLENLKLISS